MSTASQLRTSQARSHVLSNLRSQALATGLRRPSFTLERRPGGASLEYRARTARSCTVSAKRNASNSVLTLGQVWSAVLVVAFVLGWAVVAWVYFSFSNAPL